MKQCSNCEIEFKGPHDKCSNCRGNKPMAISAKNFKWRVAIETCENGHAHVPTKIGCEVCANESPAMRPCGGCGKPLLPHKYKFCNGKCQSKAYTPSKYGIIYLCQSTRK